MFREKFFGFFNPNQFRYWSNTIHSNGSVDGVAHKPDYSDCLMYGPTHQVYWPNKPTLFSA